MVRTGDNCLYTGQTSDLDKRLKQHRNGKGAKYLRGKSFDLVYREIVDDLSRALRREAEIKALTKKKKEELLAQSANVVAAEH